MPRWLPVRLLVWGTRKGVVRWWCEEHPGKRAGHDGCGDAGAYPTVLGIAIR
jgi:hypothetical protein